MARYDRRDTVRSTPTRVGGLPWDVLRFGWGRRSPAGRVGRFALHFGEMCIPMCVGFAIGDAVYFAIAGALGYSRPFSELPELSLLVVTFNMTWPMVACMRVRGMAWRPTAEMAGLDGRARARAACARCGGAGQAAVG